jgi:hypothetical protein
MSTDEHEGMYEEKEFTGEYQMQYQVAKANSLDALETQVIGLLDDGWVPCGSLVVVQNLDGSPLFYQPMVGKAKVYRIRWVHDEPDDDIPF